MMRLGQYQRVSPDCLHLNNGRKQANLRTYKDEDASENGRFPSYGHSFDGKAGPLRYRSGTTPPRQDHSSFSHIIASTDTPQSDGATATATATQKNQYHENSPSPSPSRGGDLLLQWGHNKRSRGSRAENRTVTDESSIQPRPLIKLQRRGGADKHGIINQQQIMPPPPPPPPTCSSSCTTITHGRGGNLRSFSTPVRDTTGSPLNRNPEDRSGLRNGSSSSNSGAGASSRVGGGVSRSAEKRSPSSPEKTENRKMGSSTVTNMVNEKQQQQQQMVMMMNGGSMGQADHGSRVESTAGASTEQGGGGGVSHGVTIGAGGGMEKVNLEVLEWPRIYVSLSRKEKEDDFYAMKGTKLPQRPKKRAKNIDKTLQYCFPGMWLSDLTRGRYEVREKKCVKKQKRRGLKGMESMESDSE